MGYERYIDALVCASLKETYLTASDTFFSWCAEDDNLPRQVVLLYDTGCRETGCE
jgi:hypothetical protein